MAPLHSEVLSGENYKVSQCSTEFYVLSKCCILSCQGLRDFTPLNTYFFIRTIENILYTAYDQEIRICETPRYVNVNQSITVGSVY